MARRGVQMATNEPSPQLQDQLKRLQQMQNQLQIISSQRQQIEMQLRETEEAIKELEKVTEKTPVYKSVGSLLVKSKGKKVVLEELKKNKESLDLRKQTLTTQEGREREKFNELQSKIQNALSLSGNET